MDTAAGGTTLVSAILEIRRGGSIEQSKPDHSGLATVQVAGFQNLMLTRNVLIVILTNECEHPSFGAKTEKIAGCTITYFR